VPLLARTDALLDFNYRSDDDNPMRWTNSHRQLTTHCRRPISAEHTTIGNPRWRQRY